MLRSRILKIKYLPDITNLATKNALSAKINEVKVEIPSISGLGTTSALTA